MNLFEERRETKVRLFDLNYAIGVAVAGKASWFSLLNIPEPFAKSSERHCNRSTTYQGASR